MVPPIRLAVEGVPVDGQRLEGVGIPSNVDVLLDPRKPVLQTRARVLDMIGELEVAFEIPLGNALVD